MVKRDLDERKLYKRFSKAALVGVSLSLDKVARQPPQADINRCQSHHPSVTELWVTLARREAITRILHLACRLIYQRKEGQ